MYPWPRHFFRRLLQTGSFLVSLFPVWPQVRAHLARVSFVACRYNHDVRMVEKPPECLIASGLGDLWCDSSWFGFCLLFQPHLPPLLYMTPSFYSIILYVVPSPSVSCSHRQAFKLKLCPVSPSGEYSWSTQALAPFLPFSLMFVLMPISLRAVCSHVLSRLFACTPIKTLAMLCGGR